MRKKSGRAQQNVSPRLISAIGFPLLSGLALLLSFPKFAYFPLAWVALIPYLDFCVRKRRVSELLIGHLLFTALYFGGILYWIPRVLVFYGGIPWSGSLPVFLLMILLLSLVFVSFTALTQWIGRYSEDTAIWMTPGIWALAELLRNYYPFNGFPWASLGYSQFPYKLILQSLDIGGVYLLSASIVTVNAGILFSLRRKSWRTALFVTLFFGMLNLYGVYRLHFWDLKPTGVVQVGLVQGNIELSRDREYYAQKYFEDVPRLFDRAVESGARWVILPEAQNPYYFPSDFYFKVFWEQKVRLSETYLLFNATRVSEEGSNYFNSVHLLNPEGKLVYQYDKAHLVPFGEYLPVSALLDSFEPLVAEVSSFTPGTSRTLGKVGGVPFATLICYESIFPELSRDFVERGAGLLVNMTNDLWFGDTAAPIQHFQMAAFRSVETRKSMLRVANSGVTAIVNPYGEVRSMTKLFSEAVVREAVQSNQYKTLFVQFGHGPLIAFIIVLGVIGLISRNR